MLGSYLKQFSYNPNTDGKEPFQKVVGLGKFALYTGVISSGMDLCLVRPPPNYKVALIQGGKHYFGWLALSTTFATSVLFLTNLRHKDDPWNYAIASLITGGVLYSITGQGYVACWLAGLTALGTAIWKDQIMRGYVLHDKSSVPVKYASIYFNFENSPDVRYMKQN